MKKKLLLIITAFLWLELAFSQSSQRPDFLKKTVFSPHWTETCRSFTTANPRHRRRNL